MLVPLEINTVLVPFCGNLGGLKKLDQFRFRPEKNCTVFVLSNPIHCMSPCDRASPRAAYEAPLERHSCFRSREIWSRLCSWISSLDLSLVIYYLHIHHLAMSPNTRSSCKPFSCQTIDGCGKRRTGAWAAKRVRAGSLHGLLHDLWAPWLCFKIFLGSNYC